ncbi:MAPK kinase substrate protein At1g80180-like [Apium graveolens]|uniref:MAPK kinase substrate protein At1g80180-like n=1 Tax=Apium graveolens TaxID=4045 RepID=UPI003D78F88E
MEGLVRSESTFRRSGSSGLVWDDKFLSGELKPVQTKEGGDQDSSDNNKDKTEQPKQAYKTVEVTPTVDPPSPKVSAGCGICFGKSKPAKKSAATAHKRFKPAGGHRKS